MANVKIDLIFNKKKNCVVIVFLFEINLEKIRIRHEKLERKKAEFFALYFSIISLVI